MPFAASGRHVRCHRPARAFRAVPGNRRATPQTTRAKAAVNQASIDWQADAAKIGNAAPAGTVACRSRSPTPGRKRPAA
ncbi:hypothetical protein BI344_00730 [Chromobacterium sphagni]|uniref:Uncharacterized protein n=2 Tax=Chromobacterium sphagni TaxID=1903179 RepID=A0ABX3CG41_9NEIS|nr:hypothetical protein BI344_00730 [Chromobacterium sphagni]